MICAYPLIGRFIIFKQAEEKVRLKKMKEIICTTNYICLCSRCMYKLYPPPPAKK